MKHDCGKWRNHDLRPYAIIQIAFQSSLPDARQNYLYLSGAAAYRQQKYDEALALLEELLALNPNFRPASGPPLRSCAPAKTRVAPDKRLIAISESTTSKLKEANCKTRASGFKASCSI